MFILCLFSLLTPTQSLSETLTGQVLDKRGIPVPGMEVRLYHPGPGLSRPRYTNQNGIYFFNFVPPVQGSYSIEYYWRGRLIYRGPVTVIGNTRLPPIRL